MSYKIRVSARAILLQEESILLVEFGGGQYYNFIGGGIEEGETARQAVVREVLEESGLTVEAGELVFSLEYEPSSCNYRYGPHHHISFFFRCYLDESVAPQVPSHTDINPDNPAITSVAKWIPLSALGEITFIPKVHGPLMRYIETGVFTPSLWTECE